MLSSRHDARKLDNLGGLKPVALLHTFRSIVERGVEGVEPERPDNSGCRVGNIDKPTARLELNRLLTDNRRNTKRHNAFSRPGTIRQRANKRPLLKLGKSKNGLIFRGLRAFNLRWFAPVPAQLGGAAVSPPSTLSTASP